MKNILLVIIFIGFSLTTAFGQATYYKYLQNNTALPKTYDTLYVQELDKNYELLNITLENVGAVACTLAVKGGSFYRNAASWRADEWQYPVTGTVYYDVPMRDYLWEVPTSIILAAGTSRTYLILKPYLDAIKVYITNTAGGKVKVLIEPTKPPK